MLILRMAVAVVLILVGMGWVWMCVMAGGMADREVNWLTEIWLPAAPGLIPIALGIWMLCK